MKQRWAIDRVTVIPSGEVRVRCRGRWWTRRRAERAAGRITGRDTFGVVVRDDGDAA